MKKLLLIPILAIFVACSPTKVDYKTTVDVYCDSCNVLIRNSWYSSQESGTDIIYDGIVKGYRSFEFNRYVSDINCVRADYYDDYSTSDVIFVIKENSDSTVLLNNNTGFCY